MDLLDPSASQEYAIQCIKWCLENGETDALQEHLKLHISKIQIPDDMFAELLLSVVTKSTAGILQILLANADNEIVKTEICKGGKSLLDKMLYRAVERGDAKMTENIVDKGADVNALYHGRPILHTAVCLGHLQIAEILIKAGADINSTDKKANGIVPNVITSQLDPKVAAIRWLIAHGADLHQKSASGKSPMHVAASHAADVLGVLIENGHDVNVGDDITNDTPIHVACGRACQETILKLIQHGAKFNKKNKLGQTPLAKLLKSTQEVNDFHSKTRIDIAKKLVNIGFRLQRTGPTESPAKSVSNKRKGRDKVYDRYTSIRESSNLVPLLQNLSRSAIVEKLVSGIGTEKQISELDIPFNLKRYLLFRDFDLTT